MKKFSEILNDISNENFIRSSQNYLENKYFKKFEENSEFLEENFRFYARKLKYFIPFEIYTFYYVPIYKDVLEFYDKRPFVFVIKPFIEENTGNKTILGFNINFLPPKERIKFFDICFITFKTFSTFYENDSVRHLEQIKLSDIIDAKFIDKYFAKHIKNINFIWRKYIYSEIFNPILIEREDYYRLPYYNSKFTTIPIEQIYLKFLK